MVITKFIRGAREVEVDAVAKDGRVSQNPCVYFFLNKVLNMMSYEGINAAFFYFYVIVIHL